MGYNLIHDEYWGEYKGHRIHIDFEEQEDNRIAWYDITTPSGDKLSADLDPHHVSVELVQLWIDTGYPTREQVGILAPLNMGDILPLLKGELKQEWDARREVLPFGIVEPSDRYRYSGSIIFGRGRRSSFRAEVLSVEEYGAELEVVSKGHEVSISAEMVVKVEKLVDKKGYLDTKRYQDNHSARLARFIKR